MTANHADGVSDSFVRGTARAPAGSPGTSTRHQVDEYSSAGVEDGAQRGRATLMLGILGASTVGPLLATVVLLLAHALFENVPVGVAAVLAVVAVLACGGAGVYLGRRDPDLWEDLRQSGARG